MELEKARQYLKQKSCPPGFSSLMQFVADLQERPASDRLNIAVFISESKNPYLLHLLNDLPEKHDLKEKETISIVNGFIESKGNHLIHKSDTAIKLLKGYKGIDLLSIMLEISSENEYNHEFWRFANTIKDWGDLLLDSFKKMSDESDEFDRNMWLLSRYFSNNWSHPDLFNLWLNKANIDNVESLMANILYNYRYTGSRRKSPKNTRYYIGSYDYLSLMSGRIGKDKSATLAYNEMVGKASKPKDFAEIVRVFKDTPLPSMVAKNTQNNFIDSTIVYLVDKHDEINCPELSERIVKSAQSLMLTPIHFGVKNLLSVCIANGYSEKDFFEDYILNRERFIRRNKGGDKLSFSDCLIQFMSQAEVVESIISQKFLQLMKNISLETVSEVIPSLSGEGVVMLKKIRDSNENYQKVFPKARKHILSDDLGL